MGICRSRNEDAPVIHNDHDETILPEFLDAVQRCEALLGFSKLPLEENDRMALSKTQSHLYEAVLAADFFKKRWLDDEKEDGDNEGGRLIWKSLQNCDDLLRMLSSHVECKALTCQSLVTFLVPRDPDGPIYVMPFLEDDGNYGARHIFDQSDQILKRSLCRLTKVQRDQAASLLGRLCHSSWVFPYSDHQHAILHMTGHHFRVISGILVNWTISNRLTKETLYLLIALRKHGIVDRNVTKLVLRFVEFEPVYSYASFTLMPSRKTHGIGLLANLPASRFGMQGNVEQWFS